MHTKRHPCQKTLLLSGQVSHSRLLQDSVVMTTNPPSPTEAVAESVHVAAASHQASYEAAGR